MKIEKWKICARTFIIIEVDFLQNNSAKRIDAHILIANYNNSFIVNENVHAIKNIERLNKINSHIAASAVAVVVIVIAIATILFALEFIGSWYFVNRHRFLIGNC